MSQVSVHQLRSGEGWLLTDASHADPSLIPEALSDLLIGPLLVASEEFESWTPPGGEQLEAHLHAFSGEDAVRMLREWRRWATPGALFACVPRPPDADARRRHAPDALRPWDAERLGATFYGQLGKRFAAHGLWFALERDRARYLEAAFRRLVEEAGHRMPNGDVGVVFDLPADQAVEAEFRVRGRGESFRVSRRFPELGVRRTWRVRDGEWEGEETRTSGRRRASLGRRLVQGLASGLILVLSLPVFLLVALIALVTKLAGSGTAPAQRQARVIGGGDR